MIARQLWFVCSCLAIACGPPRDGDGGSAGGAGGDVDAAIAPNDPTTHIRIKAGPASGALVVNRIELCIEES